MAYHLSIEQHDGYIHAVVTGTRSAKNAARFLRDVHEACMSRGITAALVEIRFTGPSLDTGTIFGVIAERSRDARDLRKIAYVDGAEADAEKRKFAETVAVNRGVPVRLFQDVEEAKRWLAE